MNEPFDFTKKLATEAGKTLLGFYRASGIEQSRKADKTVVTEADLAADEMIRTAIRKEYPQDGILSEEENTTYPSGKRFVWVIDPLDGTTNFSLGLHHWGDETVDAGYAQQAHEEGGAGVQDQRWTAHLNHG